MLFYSSARALRWGTHQQNRSQKRERDSLQLNKSSEHQRPEENSEQNARCSYPYVARITEATRRVPMPCIELALRNVMIPEKSPDRGFFLKKSEPSTTLHNSKARNDDCSVSPQNISSSSGDSDLTLERMEVRGGSSNTSSDKGCNPSLEAQVSAATFSDSSLNFSLLKHSRCIPEGTKQQQSINAEEDWLELGLASGSCRKSDPDMKSGHDDRLLTSQDFNAEEYIRYHQQQQQQQQQQLYYNTGGKMMAPLLPPAVMPQFPHFNSMSSEKSTFLRNSDVHSFASILNLTTQDVQRRSNRNWMPPGESSTSWGGTYSGVETLPLRHEQDNFGRCSFTSVKRSISEISEQRLPGSDLPSYFGDAFSRPLSKHDASASSPVPPFWRSNRNPSEKFRESSWSENTRIIRPSRSSETGVWFTLQALDDHDRDRVLPQIPRNYVRIKDGNTTIQTVKKYLANKLGLDNESEVEIRCRGQQLLSSFTLQHVRDAMWSSSFKDDNVPIKFVRDYESTNNSFDPSNHMMVLHYRRS